MSTSNFKQIEIDLIPEDWEVMRLGEVFDIFAGGDISKLNWSPIYSNSLENDKFHNYYS